MSKIKFFLPVLFASIILIVFWMPQNAYACQTTSGNNLMLYNGSSGGGGSSYGYGTIGDTIIIVIPASNDCTVFEFIQTGGPAEIIPGYGEIVEGTGSTGKETLPTPVAGTYTFIVRAYKGYGVSQEAPYYFETNEAWFQITGPSASIKARRSGIGSFTAGSITVPFGSKIDLNWTSSGAYNCGAYSSPGTSIAAYVSAVSGTVTPLEEMHWGQITYGLSCWNSSGQVVATSQVIVNTEAGVDLEISGDGINWVDTNLNLSSGQNFYFKWVSNTSTCSFSPPVSSGVNTSGSEYVLPSHPYYPSSSGTTYNISCTAGGTTVTDSGTAKGPPVAPIEPPNVDLKGRQAGSGSYTNGPLTINAGSNIDLQWTIDEASATSCTATNAWSGSKSVSSPSTQLNISVPASPSTHTFSIQCSGSGGTGNTDSFVVNVIPATPTITSAVPGSCGSGQITVSWTTSAGATLYQLYRDGTLVYNNSGTTYLDTNRTAGQTYSYTVRAYNSYGVSPLSSPVNATAPSSSCAGNPTPTIIATPGSCGTGQISLSWGASGANSYTVKRGGTTIYTGPLTSRTDSGLTAGQTYTYTVDASFPSGSPNPTTASANATAPSNCAPIPSVTLTANPTNGAVNVVNPTLTWTVVNGATSCTASGDWSGAKSVAGGSQPMGVLNTVKTYTYVLTCTNTYGSGSDDATVVVSGPGFGTINVKGRVAGSGAFVEGPITITSGGNADLIWTFTGSGNPYCQGTSNPAGWSVYGETNGSRYGVGPHTLNTTYTMYCEDLSDSSKNSTDSFVVNITQPSATINVTSNQSGTSWNVVGGSGATPASGNYPSQSHTVTPGGGTAYTIQPSNLGGYTSSCSYTGSSSGSSCAVTVFAGNTINMSITYTAVPPAFDYSLSATNASAVQGQTGQSSVTKTLVSGTTETVNLTATGLPSGVTVTYPNQGCAPSCTGYVNFSISSGVSTGNYSITITGQSSPSGITRLQNILLSVTSVPPSDLSLTVNPTAPRVNQSTKWTAIVNGGTGCSYTWSGSDIPSPVSTGGSNTFSIIYQTTGTKTVSVTANCTEGSASGSASVIVSVKPIFEEF